jgi:hypothetical protein
VGKRGLPAHAWELPCLFGCSRTIGGPGRLDDPSQHRLKGEVTLQVLRKARHGVKRIREMATGHFGEFPLFETGAKSPPAQEIFTIAYDRYQWGSEESRSGVGSELAATENVRAYLPELFGRLNVRSFLDAPCGDWNWMQHVDLSGIEYIGADVVPKIIDENTERYARPGMRFVVADLATADLPRADLIMCRDCWVHLSFRDISAILENFRRSGAEWLLVNTTASQRRNRNKRTGLMWRYLNLELPPFEFPPPIEARKDHRPDAPFQIALWRLAELPKIAA